MEEQYKEEAPRSGYPEGFEGEIGAPSQNVMPEFQPKSGLDLNYKVIGIAAGSFFFVISIILIVAFALKNKSSLDEEGYKAVAESFVETVSEREPKLFDAYIYPESGDEMKGYMKKVVKTFSDAEDLESDISYKEEDKAWGADIDLSWNVGIEEYSTTASLKIVAKDDKWYLYSCSFSDIEKKGGEIAETTEEMTEEPAPQRTFVTVGSENSGLFEAPENFSLTTFSVSGLDVAYDYTLTGSYNDKSEMVSVIVYTGFSPLQELAESLSNSLYGTVGEISVVQEKGGDVYTETREDGETVTVLRTFTGADGICRSFIVKYEVSDITLAAVWDTYNLPGGLVEEASITDAVPEGMQRIGSDSLGYIDIGLDFVPDEGYTTEGLDSIGYSYENATVCLINYSGTKKADMPTLEFAEDIRTNLLGNKGSEFETGDWFPGAYYSYAVGKDGNMTELYAFKGNDGVNRLIFFIHPEEDTVTGGYYSSYKLGVGVMGLEE